MDASENTFGFVYWLTRNDYIAELMWIQNCIKVYLDYQPRK